jgi:hypothetical protein
MRRLHTPDDLAGIADAVLGRVILQRFRELAKYDDFSFDELAEFWLVEPDDTIEHLEVATSLPIAHGWFSDARYPDPDFAPGWEVLEAHPTGFEMVFVTSDSGYGTVLWIPATGSNDTLLTMCAEYASLAPLVADRTDAAT